MHLDSKCASFGKYFCDLPGGSLESFFRNGSFFFDRCQSVSRVSPNGSARDWRPASDIFKALRVLQSLSRLRMASLISFIYTEYSVLIPKTRPATLEAEVESCSRYVENPNTNLCIYSGELIFIWLLLISLDGSAWEGLRWSQKHQSLGHPETRVRGPINSTAAITTTINTRILVT